MYRKKILPMFRWVFKFFLRKEKNFFYKLIAGIFIVIFIVFFRPYKISIFNLLKLEPIFALLSIIGLFIQRKCKNEWAVRPLLDMLFLFSAIELFVSLSWDITVGVVFHSKKLIEIFCAVFYLIVGISSWLIKKYYFQSSDTYSPQNISIYPEREQELKSVIRKIEQDIKTNPIYILIEGNQGIGKKTFLRFISDQLHDNSHELVQIDIDISKMENREIEKFLLNNLKKQLKKMGIYVGGFREYIINYLEIIKIFFKSIEIKILKDVLSFEKMIPFLIEKDSVQTVQNIISKCSSSEIIFVTLSGIKNNTIEKAYNAIHQLKDMLCCSRCILIVSCNTNVLQKFSENIESEGDIDDEFDYKINLKPLNYNKLFEYNQKLENTIWNIHEVQYVNIADEYEKLKNNMDRNLLNTLSNKDTNRQEIKEKFNICKEYLDKTFKNPKKSKELCNNLQKDINIINDMTKLYPVKEKQEFFKTYDCIQNLLLLNIIQTVYPTIYRELYENGFSYYIEHGEWDEKNDAVIYGLLYLYKGKRSPYLNRKKQFISKFLEGNIDVLYQESRRTLQYYKNMLNQNEYGDIDVADMIFQYIRQCSNDTQNPDDDVLNILFTKVLPWQIEHLKKNTFFAYELLYQLFKQYELDHYLMPNIPFWSAFENFVKMKKWKLYDINYVNNLQLFLVKSYVPLTFKHFNNLFEYSNIERCMDVHIEAMKTSRFTGNKNLEEEIGLFVSEYLAYFPNIEDQENSLDILKRMVSYSCERLNESGIIEDTNNIKSIRLAKLQLKELISLDEVLNGILAPQIEQFTHQMDMPSLTEAIYSILDECSEYPVVVKGQIENAIEKMIKSYDMNTLSEYHKRNFITALNKLKEAFDRELNEIEKPVIKSLMILHDN